MSLNKGLIIERKYGTFDCFSNSLLYLMYKFELNPLNLFRFNFNIQFNKIQNVLTGSVYPDPLYDFSGRELGIKFISTTSEEITKHTSEWVIVPLDIFDLPYVKGFYKKIHQLHYVVASVKRDSIEVYDLYFNTSWSLSFENFLNSWGYFNEPVYLVDSIFQPQETLCTPYLKDTDYFKKYDEFYEVFHSQIRKILNNKESEEERLLNKLFGSIGSLIQNREIHYEVVNNMALKKSINSWTVLQKELIKLTSGLTDSPEKIQNILYQAIDEEIKYLKII